MFELEQIDFNELYDLLLDSSRKAFLFVQHNYPQETFYTFGFDHRGGYFIYPLCNSEESHVRWGNLTTSEQENQTLEWFYTRWNYYSWEYNSLIFGYFRPVGRWLYDNIDGYDGVSKEQELAWKNISYKISDTCMKVLKRLDQERLWGEGLVRERVVLINMGGDDFADCVWALNPTATYELWCVEFELFQHANSILPRERFVRRTK